MVSVMMKLFRDDVVDVGGCARCGRTQWHAAGVIVLKTRSKLQVLVGLSAISGSSATFASRRTGPFSFFGASVSDRH